jgi:predicted transcriptional regulator
MSNNNNKKPEPTKAELEILQVLWQHGPSTVRFVNDQMNKEQKEVQYTTTLRLMQIMFEKKLLLRDESNMKHVYQPAEDERKLKGLLLNRFLESAFNGSASNLMMQLLDDKKVSKKELDEIRALLDKL